jgi:hypothetical protein
VTSTTATAGPLKPRVRVGGGVERIIGWLIVIASARDHIELINFTDGDLFMLGTIFSANFLVDWLGFTSPSLQATLALILTFLATMAFVRSSIWAPSSSLTGACDARRSWRR